MDFESGLLRLYDHPYCTVQHPAQTAQNVKAFLSTTLQCQDLGHKCLFNAQSTVQLYLD